MSETPTGVVEVQAIHDFAAPPERLWRAFTEPAEMARWWWGRNAPNPSAEIDLRVGGRYRVGKDAPSDDDSGWGTDRWYISGVLVEISPYERLIFTLHWEGPVGYNQTGDAVLDEAAVVTFEPHDGGTRLVYRHIGIPDDGVSAGEHLEGIAATLRDLNALIAVAAAE